MDKMTNFEDFVNEAKSFNALKIFKGQAYEDDFIENYKKYGIISDRDETEDGFTTDELYKNKLPDILSFIKINDEIFVAMTMSWTDPADPFLLQEDVSKLGQTANIAYITANILHVDNTMSPNDIKKGIDKYNSLVSSGDFKHMSKINNNIKVVIHSKQLNSETDDKNVQTTNLKDFLK